MTKQRSRLRHKGRGGAQRFVGIPMEVAESAQFAALSGNAVKFVMELARQYHGPNTNNGGLQLPWKVARLRGFKSPGTLQRAKEEAIDAGLAVCTRQGGKNLSSLFALTFWSVDECGGIHEWPTSHAPSHCWRTKVVVPMSSNLVPMSISDIKTMFGKAKD